GLDAVVDAPPALPEIVTLVERAVRAARRRAQRGDQRPRAVRRDYDVARVSQGREAPDLHVLPRAAAVGAAEETHAHGQEDGARQSARHGQRVSVQHALVLGVAGDAALEVRPLGELHEIVADVLPRLTAVAAAQDAVDFQARVDL